MQTTLVSEDELPQVHEGRIGGVIADDIVEEVLEESN